ncbi:ABC transporter substrate-binding protein [Gordonibacter massiliensis (ex Traore et al. 2017)]|uniref:ABC transporter substrate-binding protein n=1 Tax=Gordonibacter massiliensis (ex Traore et al. 2017) TaxID=1841863 RepID=A0A842JHU6_9ACTN|nr:ABC transporter substrate-binding protein [Gordonibacter massiliensis (ex Traore et al. 2017)]MBC2890616.1 ABC transporter substrate-binding protein [Gordonibacter massiliensis (ex Traore et al. 2017)]
MTIISQRIVPTAVAASFAATMLLAGCSTAQPEAGADAGAPKAEAQSAPQAGAVTFTDDTGTEVAVDNPQRVVACMGSFASMWELAGGTLVGASDDAFTLSDYDLKSENVQKVGDFANLNLESIIALEPDFVIMTSGSGGRGGDSNQADLKAALVASNIPVACFQVTTFDDYLRMLRTCCDVTGRDDLYEQNGQAVSDRIEAVKAKVPAGEAPSALVLTTYSGGTRVQASSTMTGAMLADLGVKNLSDENPSLLKDFSLESIIEMDPDFIFVVPMGNDDAAAMKALEDQTAANPAWSTLSAVRDGRYVALDPHLFQYKPNERWDQSYQVLFDALYA